MNIILYIIIFVAKVIENALGTLRFIVIANNRKGLGAFLQFLISLVWISTTGIVVVDINEDPLKIFFFALGSLVGSYYGNIIEEKMALGSNMLIAIIDAKHGKKIVNELRNNDFAVTVLKGKGKNKTRYVLMIVIPRRKQNKIVEIINNIDSSAMIISEKASTISGGYYPSKKLP